MRKKALLFGFCACILAISLFFSTSKNFSKNQLERKIIPAESLEATVLSNKPVNILIPTLNIDARILEVGLTQDGKMDVPHSLTEAGWYKYGTIPGSLGSAVIDGHVDDGSSKPGVFKRLKELKNGQDVFVKTENGKQVHYVVTDVKRYYYADLPLDNIFNKNDAAYLNLITCDGTWLSKDKGTDHRIVIYTKLVN